METLKIRNPAVAGQFYPSSGRQLKDQIASLAGEKTKKEGVIACMLPHAGYAYSGRVAVETVSQIIIKDKIILLGPNHTGYGAKFSIMAAGIWHTPLGNVNIDTGLAKALLKNSRYLEEDELAHAYEHSLEVELPILQYFKADFEIVPITVMAGQLQALKELGREIAGAIQESGLKDSVLLVASSDMTHYEAQEEAQKKDQQAIKAILELSEDRLMERVARLNISMCGYAPVIIMLAAAKQLGAKSARLIKYQTSGEVTGDKESVVGYAGITIH